MRILEQAVSGNGLTIITTTKHSEISGIWCVVRAEAEVTVLHYRLLEERI